MLDRELNAFYPNTAIFICIKRIYKALYNQVYNLYKTLI